MSQIENALTMLLTAQGGISVRRLSEKIFAYRKVIEILTFKTFLPALQAIRC